MCAHHASVSLSTSLACILWKLTYKHIIYCGIHIYIHRVSFLWNMLSAGDDMISGTTLPRSNKASISNLRWGCPHCDSSTNANPNWCWHNLRCVFWEVCGINTIFQDLRSENKSATHEEDPGFEDHPQDQQRVHHNPWVLTRVPLTSSNYWRTRMPKIVRWCHTMIFVKVMKSRNLEISKVQHRPSQHRWGTGRRLGRSNTRWRLFWGWIQWELGGWNQRPRGTPPLEDCDQVCVGGESKAS